jgi:hypothetical protein
MKMKRRDFTRMLGALAIVPVVGRGTETIGIRRRWALTADVAECCSCAIPCSCNFGRPEAGTCHGTRLIQIRDGDLDGVSLAGATFVVSFHMGSWTRIYLDEGLGDARGAALERLLPLAFAGFDRLARVKMRVPISVTAGSDTFRFSVPESAVEMRLLPGLDGAPIRIEGLPSVAYQEYVQFESVVHTHRSDETEWSYSGTNGFRSVMRAAG